MKTQRVGENLLQVVDFGCSLHSRHLHGAVQKELNAIIAEEDEEAATTTDRADRVTPTKKVDDVGL